MGKTVRVLCNCILCRIIIYCQLSAVAAALALSGEARATDVAEHPALKGESAELGEFLLAALWHSRDALQSVRYDASEDITIEAADGRIFETRATIEAAFDYGKSRYRVIYQHGSDTERSRAYIETPHKVFNYSEATGFAIINRANNASRMRPDAFLDVRNLGILSSSEVQRHVFHDVRDALAKSSTVKGFAGNAKDTYTLVMIQGGNQPWERRMTLDGKKDYAPTHLEIRFKNPESGEWMAPRHTANVNYVSESGVWVPSTVTLFNNGRKGRVVRKLNFHWRQVNSPLSDKLFARESLSLSPGTRVVDTRLDPDNPIVVEQIDDGSNGNTIRREGLPFGRKLLLWVTGAVIVAIVLFVIYRWRAG